MRVAAVYDRRAWDCVAHQLSPNPKAVAGLEEVFLGTIVHRPTVIDRRYTRGFFQR